MPAPWGGEVAPGQGSRVSLHWALIGGKAGSQNEPDLEVSLVLVLYRTLGLHPLMTRSWRWWLSLAASRWLCHGSSTSSTIALHRYGQGTLHGARKVFGHQWSLGRCSSAEFLAGMLFSPGTGAEASDTVPTAVLTPGCLPHSAGW